MSLASPFSRKVCHGGGRGGGHPAGRARRRAAVTLALSPEFERRSSGKDRCRNDDDREEESPSWDRNCRRDPRMHVVRRQRQIARSRSDHIIDESRDDQDHVEESFESLESSVRIIPANTCDDMGQYFEAVMCDDGGRGLLAEESREISDESYACHDDIRERGKSGERPPCERRREREAPPRGTPPPTAEESPAQNSCLGLSAMMDKALTRVADALFDSMSCGIDDTCNEWMNVPGVDGAAGCKFFVLDHEEL